VCLILVVGCVAVAQAPVTIANLSEPPELTGPPN
jgi:hypothetical protein